MDGGAASERDRLRVLEHTARQRDGSATPLHAAAPRNVRAPLDVARLLLARGARADERDRERLAALHYAAWDGHVDLARTLLDRGADASASNARGLTPLWYARRLGREPMVILLRSRGAAE